MGETINYIRVSSVDQNPDRQIDGLPKADKVFIEKASGSTTKRPKLQEMLEYIRAGDQVNVYSIDRLARDIEDLNKLVKKIAAIGCKVTFHKENLVFGNGDNTAMSDLLFNILGSFAQFERSMIRERQAEGIAAAKARGKHMGRPPSVNDRQKDEIIEKSEAGATPTALAREYNISRATVYSIIQGRRGRD